VVASKWPVSAIVTPDCTTCGEIKSQKTLGTGSFDCLPPVNSSKASDKILIATVIRVTMLLCISMSGAEVGYTNNYYLVGWAHRSRRTLCTGAAGVSQFSTCISNTITAAI
jgi:hypothetical protein